MPYTPVSTNLETAVKTLFAVVAITVAATIPVRAAAQQRLPSDSLEIGAKYVQWLLGGEVDSLLSVATPEALERMGGRDGIMEVMDMIGQRAGLEVEVLEEKYVTRNGAAQFWHTGQFSGMDEPLQIRWVINRDGEIAGAGINPASQAPMIDADIEP